MQRIQYANLVTLPICAALFNASTAFAIIGKFFASLGFGLVYTVTSEIFPTDAR